MSITHHYLEHPEMTELTRESGVSTPVVARGIPWLVEVHLERITSTRISHHKLLHGYADFSIVNAAVTVGIKSVVEPLSLIGSHNIVECSKKALDFTAGDATVTRDLVPDALELGLTLWSPDRLEVHVGSQLTPEHREAARKTARRNRAWWRRAVHGARWWRAVHGTWGWRVVEARARWRRVVEGAGWRRMVEARAGWRRMVEARAGWRRMVEARAGWRRMVMEASAWGWRAVVNGTDGAVMAGWRAVMARRRAVMAETAAAARTMHFVKL